MNRQKIAEQVQYTLAGRTTQDHPLVQIATDQLMIQLQEYLDDESGDGEELEHLWMLVQQLIQIAAQTMRAIERGDDPLTVMSTHDMTEEEAKVVSALVEEQVQHGFTVYSSIVEPAQDES